MIWQRMSYLTMPLSSSFLFLSVVFCPSKLPCISSKVQAVLAALAGAKIEQGAVIAHVHDACSLWEVFATKRAAAESGHRLIPLLALFIGFSWLRVLFRVALVCRFLVSVLSHFV